MKTLAGTTFAMAVLLVACAGGDEPFPGSAPDLDALGLAVVQAFNQGDEAALASVRLSQPEHNEVIWPELPAARGDNPFPLDMAWKNIQLRNGRAVRRLVEDLGPLLPIAFEGLVCGGPTQDFETFRVLTDCFVRFSSGGSLYEAQLFKDVVERVGGHKIFRYYDEAPRKIVGAA